MSERATTDEPRVHGGLAVLLGGLEDGESGQADLHGRIVSELSGWAKSTPRNSSGEPDGAADEDGRDEHPHRHLQQTADSRHHQQRRDAHRRGDEHDAGGVTRAGPASG